MSKVDQRLLICVGMLILAGGTLYRIGFNQQMTFWQLVPAQLILGLSLPFWFLPIMSLTVSTVKAEETAAAAGLSNFIRTMATAVAVAIGTTYWLDDTVRSRVALVGELHRPASLLTAFEQIGRTPPQALRSLGNLVQSQSVMLATNHLCFAVGVMLAIAAGVVWLMPRPPLATTAPAPTH